jgi:hypothetical protein
VASLLLKRLQAHACPLKAAVPHQRGAAVKATASHGYSRALGQAGRQRARLNFSLEATVAQYEKLYSGLCEPTPRKIVEILDNPN